MSVDVSIIVPIYNSERYISECIESVLNQTYSNIELILIDDASTDTSLSIIKAYERDNREKVVVIECEINGKQGTARNLGIKKAKGKYIMFLDSDDILDKQACEMMINTANRNDADIVFCDYCMFDENRAEYCAHVSDSLMGKLNENKKKALITTSVVPWAKLIRRKLITDNDIYFPEGKFYEDQATTYLYYLYANEVSKVEKILYRYRISCMSTSTQKNQQRHFQALEMASLLFQRFKERGVYDLYYSELEYFAIEQMYCLAIERAFAQFDKFPFKYANTVLDELKSKFPNFIKNKYYRNYMPETRTKLLKAHLENQHQLLYYLKYEKKEECPNYICKLKLNVEKLKKLKCILNSKKYELALWGAGKYGKIILSEFKEHGISIERIYDRDLTKVDQEYETYIISDYRKINEDMLIVIPFVNWVPEVKRLLRENSIKGNVFNLEIYLKHDIENCIEKL